MKKGLNLILMIIGLIAIVFLALNIGGSSFEKAEAMFERGEYVSAYQEYLTLAEKGDARAMFALSKIYEQGLGRNIYDLNKAFSWTERSAMAGNAHAQVQYGNWLYEGALIKENLVGAEAVWGRASEQNLDQAFQQLLALHGFFYPQQEKAFWLAEVSRERLHKYVESGETWAKLILAMYHLDGVGANQDSAAGAALLRRAETEGMAQASMLLAYYQLKGVIEEPITNQQAVAAFMAAQAQGTRLASELYLKLAATDQISVSVAEQLFHAYLLAERPLEKAYYQPTEKQVADMEAIVGAARVEIKARALSFRAIKQPDSTIAAKGMWQ